MKQLQIRYLVAVLAVMLGLSLVVVAAEPPSGKIVIDSKKGAVTFDHTAHAEREGKCQTCHHQVPEGQEATTDTDTFKCRTCHGVADDAPKAKDAFHSTCKDCHKKVGDKAPTKCKECHAE